MIGLAGLKTSDDRDSHPPNSTISPSVGTQSLTTQVQVEAWRPYNPIIPSPGMIGGG